MKLHLLAVGNRQPAWVGDACGEYLKRMPREFPVLFTEIRPEPREGGRNAEQMLAAERVRIEARLAAHAPGSRVIVLDERGDDLTTRKFAERLEGWAAEGRDAAFVIGSADGLDAGLKSGADGSLRLSSLTLPHGLARVLLCEQLYRAVTLIKGHPYHRP